MDARNQTPKAVQDRPGRLVIENVRVAFAARSGARVAVDQFSLDIPPGQFVCVLGPSGCGKSTVLNVVAGFVKPAAGRVEIDGVDVVEPGPDRGIVFQEPTLLPWATALRNVALGPIIAGQGNTIGEATARTFLGMVGLGEFEHHYPSQLSGGMQQRVGIARALANYPRVLLMDEPFGALDAQTRAMMQEALLGVWSEFHTTVLFITHDIDEAIFLGDRVVVMSASPGRIVADIPVALPRPREARMQFSDAFRDIKQRCFDLIRAESRQAFARADSGSTSLPRP
jgi:NitT/TauT family transport system ATP-binding protein